MLEWFASQFWSAAFHWLAYWGIGVIVVGGFAVAAWFSPVFKMTLLGASIGAAVLLGAQNGLVSFKPKEPQICKNPPTDPNGSVHPQCFHKTDERGYGYWGECDGE